MIALDEVLSRLIVMCVMRLHSAMRTEKDGSLLCGLCLTRAIER